MSINTILRDCITKLVQIVKCSTVTSRITKNKYIDINLMLILILFVIKC